MAVVEAIHRLMWGPWLLFLFLGVPVDIFNGLMAIPNLIGLLWLSKEVESPFTGE